MYRPSVSLDQFYESIILYYTLRVLACILYMCTLLIFHMFGPPYVRTCHVHPIGDPEWSSDFQNFQDKEMCSTCILCNDIPDPPSVNGHPLEDARYMEWHVSWLIHVTEEDRTNCIC